MPPHRKSTKSGLDPEEARRKREENVIELRKNKRDENLLKKRQTFAAPPLAITESNKTGTSGQRLDELPMMVQGVFSSNLSEQYEATQKFRKLLSIERNPPIEEVIKTSVVPKFVEFLQRSDAPQLQVPRGQVVGRGGGGLRSHPRSGNASGGSPASQSGGYEGRQGLRRERALPSMCRCPFPRGLRHARHSKRGVRALAEGEALLETAMPRVGRQAHHPRRQDCMGPLRQQGGSCGERRSARQLTQAGPASF
mmetsp:Transcript_40778/g.121680  ORF Transcript_40778/g.121680 Transcript_40778/m.121680 type:complete len:253 (+) Transcript_40778:85-843(+)